MLLEIQGEMSEKSFAAQSAMYLNDIYVLFLKDSSSVAVAEEIVADDYSEETPILQEAIKSGLQYFHTGIVSQGDRFDELFDVYKFIEYGDLYDTAVLKMYEQLQVVCEEYDIAETAVDIYGTECADYFYNEGIGLMDLSLPLGPLSFSQDFTFEAQLDEKIASWKEFEIESDEALNKIGELFKEAGTTMVDRLNYLNPTYLLLDSLRAVATQQYYQEILRPDSSLRVQLVQQGNTEVQRINLKINRLLDHQDFIDNLLLNNRRSFGDIINDFSQFADRIDQIQYQFKRLQESDKANFGTSEFVFFLKNSLDILQQIFQIALPEEGDQATLAEIINLTDHILDAYAAVLEKDYDAIVMNVIP